MNLALLGLLWYSTAHILPLRPEVRVDHLPFGYPEWRSECLRFDVVLTVEPVVVGQLSFRPASSLSLTGTLRDRVR